MNKDYIFVQRKTTHLFPNIYAIGKIYSFTMAKIFAGKTFGSTLALMKNGVMYWYASESGLTVVSKKAFEIVKRNPLLVHKIRKKFEKIGPQIVAFTRKRIFQTNLARLSLRTLWKLMAEYLKLYDDIYVWSEPITLGLSDSMGAYLKDYLLNRLGKEKNKLTSYYNILISPVEPSFVKKEDEELLKIAREVKKNPHFDANKAIREHTKKFCWVPFDYGICVWSERYFKRVLGHILRKRNIEVDLEKSRKYFRDLPLQQEGITKKLKIDTYHQKLFRAMRDAAFLLDYKKQIFTEAHFEVTKLLEEISYRLKVPTHLVQYYLPDELEKAVTGKQTLSKAELKNRYSFGLIHWYGDKVEILTGRKAKNFLTTHQKTKKVVSKILDGVIASSGKYIGRVKIVNSSIEIAKVKEGDVLVAPMTSPDYVPAMRKAGAIITDEGGVMCHAAIISRELGIPCVVGTKNATKILKDEEIVEVNANHNSVKILKK